MRDSRRRQIYCDREVQGALMLRVLLYWLYCQLATTLLVVCWSVVTGPPRRFVTVIGDVQENYWPAFLASLLVMPIVIIDVVRMSNRFVGPVKRLRDGLQALADGREVPTIKFRDNDYWQSLAGLFNTVSTQAKQESGPEFKNFSAEPDAAPQPGAVAVEPHRSTAAELEKLMAAADQALFFDDIMIHHH
jgi:hypothetical protein